MTDKLVEQVDDILWPKFLGDTAKIRNQLILIIKQAVEAELLTDEQLRGEIVKTLEAWQDTGMDYVMAHGFNSISYEILTLLSGRIQESRKQVAGEIKEELEEATWKYPSDYHNTIDKHKWENIWEKYLGTHSGKGG